MDRHESLVGTWRRLLDDPGKSWVLYSRGTCVVLPDPGRDLVAQAAAVLAEQGPVAAATPSADFSVLHPAGAPGWVVTCHHPDILNYVSPQDVEEASDVLIGMTGRGHRDRDARAPRVVHVYDARSQQR